MLKDPKFGAAAACGVAGPVAWTVACATFLFTTDLGNLASPGVLLAEFGRAKVAFILFGTLGLLGGLIGGGKGRALSSLVAGLAVASLAVLAVGWKPDPRLHTVFPMIAGPIMGIGYSLGARSGRKISKVGFAGLCAGIATTVLFFLTYGLGRSVFFDSSLGIYLGGLVVSYVATFVFFVFYSTSGRSRANGAR